MITKRRPHSYRRHWSTLINVYGSLCYYCHIEPSTTIDHVIPYSFVPDDSLENLVPSCLTCNLTAGNMVFDDVNRKRQYIINNRKKKLTHANCTSCLLPFTYREHSPSMFLCPECYDYEYETIFARRHGWKVWLSILEDAGICVEAHRNSRERIRNLGPGNNRTRLAQMILHNEMSKLNYYEGQEHEYEYLVV